MASKIILHIGLQKSGTTFLQHILQDTSAALAGAGVLYPIPRDWSRGMRSVANHEWSTHGLLGTEYPWVSERQAVTERDSWKAVLEQVDAWPGTALLSAEGLSVIRSAAIHRLMDSLDAGEVEVVITARDLGRSLPSLWQQHVRNGRSMSFGHYLGILAEQRDRGRDHIERDPAAHIWRAYILSGLVRRWSAAGATRVSVVTTPGRPSHLLWDRFAQSIGLRDLPEFQSARDLEGPTQAHTGITMPEALVLASLNTALSESSWTGQDADRLRQSVVQAFQARADRGAKLALPPEWRPRVAEWGREDLAELPGTGVRVVGDINDLRYDPESDTSSAPSPEDAGMAGAAAILALAKSESQAFSIRLQAGRLRRRLGSAVPRDRTPRP